mgnify:CR=1 FL=1
MANTYKVMIGMDIKEYPEGITFKDISKEYQIFRLAYSEP